MAEPASTLAAGSVGTVETRYLDLPEPVRLDCGRELYPIRVAYETYGVLSPRRDNVILVCHALSGDAHAAGFAKTPPESGTRDGFAAEDRSRVDLGPRDVSITIDLSAGPHAATIRTTDLTEASVHENSAYST